MSGFKRMHRSEIGKSPYELIFRGEKTVEEVLLRVIDFDTQNLNEEQLKDVKKLADYKQESTVTWLNVDGLQSVEVLEEISKTLKLDRLVMAEVLDTEARPKIIDFENCTLISIKMLQEDRNTGRLIVENLSLILTKSILISFQERKGDVFEPVRERIRMQRKKIRSGGTDYLTFALMDIVVDNYLYFISKLGEKIEKLEENLLLNPNEVVISEINNYKRELNFLRKNVKPAKDMIFSLAKMESEFITDSTAIHFKDLQDNICQVNDASDSYREILSDQLNIYHTTVSSKLNDIMKFLTVFSVIFIPLTFIAGIYGTNFDNVPELHYHYSYHIMWAVMLVVVVIMLLFFKKKKWL